jgi:hypothetical protein
MSLTVHSHIHKILTIDVNRGQAFLQDKYIFDYII